MLHDWDGVPERTVFPGFHGRFIHSGRMTFARWRIDAGAVLPEHHHEHEQVAMVLGGEIELTVDGVTQRVKAGGVLVIPPNAVHSGRAITAVDVIDAFAPVREDYR
ncbi:MAG: cupin domain-containing protein [Devosia sp.]